MGKRRIRCLNSLGFHNIIGVDINIKRCDDSIKKYAIEAKQKLDVQDLFSVDAMIVSTPPDLHLEFAKIAIEYNIPCFIEASVILEEVIKIDKINQNNTFIAPSCTFHFHPIVKQIRGLIKNNELGNITNFTYHSGQYLPDWHPWEEVTDFYVSNRETGGGREIVPFELTWITKAMGFPKEIKGYFEKTLDLGCSIEDTYAFIMKFDGYVGSMIVDVASRWATRHLILNFERGQLIWNWDDGFLKIYDSDKKLWSNFDKIEGKAQDGYNPNIIEEMYIEEINTFIKGISNQSLFPNDIKSDIKVLELLNKIEESDGGF